MSWIEYMERVHVKHGFDVSPCIICQKRSNLMLYLSHTQLMKAAEKYQCVVWETLRCLD